MKTGEAFKVKETIPAVKRVVGSIMLLGCFAGKVLVHFRKQIVLQDYVEILKKLHKTSAR